MAEGDGVIYNQFKEQVLKGTHDLVNNTIKVALVSSYTPDIDTDEIWTDVSGNEISGSGYSSGGATLGSKAVTQDNTNDRGKFDGADTVWTGLNAGTPSHAIMYDDTPTSPADPLMAYWVVTTPSNGGNYTLQWNSNGIILLT